MKKSEADKVRPGIVEALAGAERYALPNLEAVASEAERALRQARYWANDDAPVPADPAALKEALAAFDEAAKAEGLSDAMWSPRWVLSSAVCAVLAMAQGQCEHGRKLAATVRGWARGEEAKAAERDRERTLLAYQEAFWALRRGEAPVKLSSGEGERRVKVELFGAHRACGGVIVVDGCPGPEMASEWVARAQRSQDAYVRDLAHKVEQACSKAARGAA